MPNTELKLVYQNEDFGRPNIDGNYSIRKDMKTYEFLVDNVPVINITVEYERFQEHDPRYAAAYISYNNHFIGKKDSDYLNKGYAKEALRLVTNLILQEGLVPEITVQITDDNIRSQKVARHVGYVKTKNEDYSIYHPNALKMIEEGLEFLKEEDEDLYEMQMKSHLDPLKKYIETKKEQENENIPKHTK